MGNYSKFNRLKTLYMEPNVIYEKSVMDVYECIKNNNFSQESVEM